MELFHREIPIFRNIFCGDIDRENEKELSLPDYCPDISRLIRIDATPYIENKTVSENKCIISGTFLYTVLYESDYNSSLAYATFSVPFSEKLDIKDSGKEHSITAKMKVKRIGCKMINPRKFSVRVKSVISLSVKSVARVMITDVSSLPENVFVQKEVISWNETNEQKTYEFKFNESYTLSEKSVPADDVVYSSFTAQKPECGFSDGRAVLRTSVISKILYSGEEDRNRYIMSTRTFPAEMVIDDITDENAIIRADAYVSDPEINVEVDAYGENRVIEVAYTVKVCVSESAAVSAEYATDAFVAGKESIPVKEKYVSVSPEEEITRVFSVENRFSPEQDRFFELLDHSAKIGECKVKNTDEGVFITGTYIVSVFGKTEEKYENFDLSGDFSERVSHEPLGRDIWDCDCEITESAVTLAPDGSLDVRLMVRCEIETESAFSFSPVTNIDSEDEETEKVGCLIFCYPAHDDCLWSIAKKYCVAPGEIAENNPESFSSNGDIVKKTPIRIIK